MIEFFTPILFGLFVMIAADLLIWLARRIFK